jgi:hypothetical protein
MKIYCKFEYNHITIIITGGSDGVAGGLLLLVDMYIINTYYYSPSLFSLVFYSFMTKSIIQCRGLLYSSMYIGCS